MAIKFYYIFSALGALFISTTLYIWGQPIICTCGEVKLWVGSIFDGGNSQHIADWYTLSHILHGVLVALLGKFMAPRLTFSTLFLLAITTGVAWEIIEHTDWVLGKFRATTINAGYVGDSVLNAVSDYFWMLGGFFTATAMRTGYVLVMVAILELTAALIGRDSLTLTTLMLIHPIDAIGEWQQELNTN